MKAVVDNSQLALMAGDQSRPVFRILDRAGAMTPLVVVLAALPGLFTLHNRALSDVDALWGLRGLTLLSAGHLDEFLDPAAGNEGAPLAWQPPLASWLTALSLWLWGPSRLMSLELLGYISTAALVGMVYVLLRALAGNRIAFWSACLIACHSVVLRQSQSPQPYALATLLVVSTVSLWWRYLDAGMRTSLHQIVLAGIALGMSILAGGLLGLAGAALVLFALLVALLEIDGGTERAGSKRRRKQGWRGLAALLLLFVIGFATSGWWFAWMWDRYGMEFASGWLWGLDTPAKVDVASTTADIAPETPPLALALGERFIQLIGPMFGGWIVAVPLAFRQAIWGGDERERRWLQFVLAWMVCAMVLWGCWWGLSGRRDLDLEGWSLFLLVPCVGVTAFGVDAMSRRRCASHWALAAAVIALGLCFAFGHVSDDAGNGAGWTAVAVGLVVAWVFGRAVRLHERRQQVLVAAAVLVVLSTNALGGFRLIRGDREFDSTLAELHNRLTGLKDVETCLFVTAQTPSPQLQYVLESTHPRSTSLTFPTRNEALDALNDRSWSTTSDGVVIVEWGPSKTAAEGHETELTVEPLIGPVYFEQAPLRAWIVTSPARQDST